MKHFILIVLVAVTLGVSTNRAYAWFGDAEKERRIETEQKLIQQQRDTSQWQGIAFILGIGCVVVLIIGAGIGSKARRDADRPSH